MAEAEENVTQELRALAAAERHRAWRTAAGQALDALARPNLAARVRACMEVWSCGRPWRCHLRRLCIDCAERAAYVAWTLDAAKIDGWPAARRGLVYVVRSARARGGDRPAWRRHVRGYRRFWLPATGLYSWIVLSRDPAPIRAVLGEPREVAREDLPSLYQEFVAEIQALGPEAAARAALVTGYLRSTGAGGILRGRLKLPPRRRRRRRNLVATAHYRAKRGNGGNPA